MISKIYPLYIEDLTFLIFEYNNETVDIKIYDKNKKYIRRIDNQKKTW